MFALKSVKYKAYISCVLPIIEYASICWGPTSEKLNKSIEMVQHRAARFILNVHSKKGEFKKVSISELLNILNLETLEERRTKARLTMVYKILNGHVILESDMLPKFQNYGPKRKCNSPTVGQEYHLKEPQSRLQVTGCTFFYEIPKIWNEMITNEQAKAPSVDAFKRHMTKSW